MGDSLKIQVIVDASQVAAGMSNVSSTVEAATAKIKSAFGSVANAPEGIKNSLLVLQNASRMSAEAVSEASAAINSIGNAASKAAPQVSSLDRAMALASGRMVGMAAGAGMLGGALGRVAAASSTVGPLLSAAFPVIAVIAFLDVADLAYNKILEISSGLAGWDKAAKETFDHLITLNQQTVAFNANHFQEPERLADPNTEVSKAAFSLMGI